MKSRILVAVIGIPVLAWVVLWAPSAVMLVALCLLAGIGGMELQTCVSGGQHSALTGISVIFPILTVGWYYNSPDYIVVLFLLEIIFLFAYAVLKGGAVKFDQIMAALSGSIFIGYSFAAFLRMDAMGLPRAYLLLPFILSFACDTFAYFAGRAFGKHKLAPKVSPKKTIEGSVGGILGNVVCGLLFNFALTQFDFAVISYGAMALLSLVCSIVAQLGDLSFSLIKRQYGIKDYGHLFLEHGGVLDRFDSVLFVTPVIEIALKLFSIL